jgi:polygalacturonase
MIEFPFRQNRRAFLGNLAATTLVSATSRISPAQSRTHAFDPRQFGAKGDGTTLDTAAIQSAIDAAAKRGGTVRLAQGNYVTGTLLLKSGVSLQLEGGATLLGSLNPADYKLVEPFIDGTGQTRGYALLACVDAHDCSVHGGTIDGRGAALQQAAGVAAKNPSAKPFLVLCVRSSRITIRDVKLQNSAAWTTHIFQCDRVIVDKVSIRSLGLANNDGIDIDSSTNVHISGCTIESGDDAICLKTTSPKPCKDITVTNCTLTTRCGAFKIGTETAGDFSAIRVSDCHVIRADLGAVKLLSVDGAHISDVVVERMQVDDADTPIFLRLGARGRTFRAGDAPRAAGTLSKVALRHISVKNARRVGILVSGIPGHVVEGITLEDIAITMSGDPVAQLPPTPPENPAAYPEVRMFGTALPASGLYARHLRGLTLTRLNITPVPGDARPERIVLEDSANIGAL